MYLYWLVYFRLLLASGYVAILYHHSTVTSSLPSSNPGSKCALARACVCSILEFPGPAQGGHTRPQRKETSGPLHVKRICHLPAKVRRQYWCCRKAARESEVTDYAPFFYHKVRLWLYNSDSLHVAYRWFSVFAYRLLSGQFHGYVVS